MCSSFNTASGKYYCNLNLSYMIHRFHYVIVSIPQAVSTIAIVNYDVREAAATGFNTASGKYYCN